MLHRCAVVFALLAIAMGSANAGSPRRASAARAPGFSRYVRPLIGTKATKRGYGGTLPAVARPFGMTHWTPATRQGSIGKLPYWWHDKTMLGFLGTHQPAPWMGDYGYVSLLPGVGDVRPGHALPFQHEDERAEPHRYQVRLTSAAGPIDVAMAASERAGFLRFEYPEGARPHVVVEAIHSDRFVGRVAVDPRRREVTGENPDRHSAHLGPELAKFRGYFVARFDQPFDSYGVWDDAEGPQKERRSREGRRVGAYVTFAPSARRVHVKVGTSFISVEQARRNLDRELAASGWDLDRAAEDGRAAWDEVLGRVAVEGGSEDDLVRFYTALYRTMLFPRVLSEEGRYMSAADDRVHKGASYNDFSLWDTFRAQHPLLLLTAPERVNDMITALLQMYDEGGRLPLWPNPMETNIMIGTHADCVIADAYVKGFRGFDVKKAWAAVRKNAFEPPVGDDRHRFEDRMPWSGKAAPPAGTGFEARAGLTWYRTLGFVPYDRSAESVSRTVEYSIDDFCAAQLAQALGTRADHADLVQGSGFWRNVLHPKTKMLEPRNVAGAWFDGRYAWETDAEKGHPGFTEGGMWTYLFGAMHDVPGMIEALGGARPFTMRLDENFDEKHHVHENEPGHHYPYLYDWVGQPAKTEARVRAILADHYGAGPDGLLGDEDCGQMSAWFIWSALGLYPVEPATGRYALGVPMFPRVTIALGKPYKGGTLVIEAPGIGKEAQWVQSAAVGDAALEQPFVTHEALTSGKAVLRFTMGAEPRSESGRADYRPQMRSMP